MNPAAKVNASVLTSARVQPHSLEAEEYLLSCCILDGADTVARCISSGIESKSFYAPANQVIFGQLVDMHKRGLPIEAGTLAEELVGVKKLDQIGGFAYLTQISGRIPTVAQVGYFIEKVVELHARREMISIASKTMEACFTHGGGENFIDEIINEYTAHIESIRDGTNTASGLINEITHNRFDFDNPIPQAVPRFSINGKPVSTPGNLTNIIAQAKAGKSALIGAFIAAAICSEFVSEKPPDTLGLSSIPPGGRLLIHLDTEQSDEDHDQFIRRAIRRSGATRPPDWLWSFRLAKYQASKLREILRAIFHHARRWKMLIFAVIIDGTADLVNDPNDQKECNPFVAELHGLAIDHNCPIINVVHENPGMANSGNGKMRGHLGSQLERKAESNIVLKKKNGVTVVFSEKMRRAPILEKDGPRFQWSDQAGMHVSVGAGEASLSSPSTKTGRTKTHTFDVFVDRYLKLIPIGRDNGIGLREMHRRTEDERPIGKEALSDLIDEAVTRDLLKRGITDKNYPIYYRE